jgi:hypothetical protein
MAIIYDADDQAGKICLKRCDKSASASADVVIVRVKPKAFIVRPSG